jgi:hypothetical protein
MIKPTRILMLSKRNLRMKMRIMTMIMAMKMGNRTRKKMRMMIISRTKLILWMKISTNCMTRCVKETSQLVKNGSLVNSFFLMKKHLVRQ